MESKILSVIFTFLCILAPRVYAATSLQTLITNTPSGGTLTLTAGGDYTGDSTISKPITIEGNNATLQGRIKVNPDVSGVTIRNLTFNRPVMFGLQGEGDNAVYENLTVLHTKLSTNCSGCDDMDGIRIAGNNVIVKNVRIDNSGVTDVGPAHPDCIQFSTWNKRASNITVDGLTCENYYQAGTTSTGSNGFQLATEKYGWENITIKNSFLHTMTCILAYEYQNGLTFEHNTCIGKPVASSYGFYAARNSNERFRNNILVDHDTPVLVPNGLSDTGNNIIYCPSSACKSDSSFPHSGQLWNINPQLDSGYHPLPGSPACLSGGGYIGAYPCGSTGNTPTPTTVSAKPGDANGDGKVDGVDYIVWLNHYGQNVSGAANGNFDGKNGVDGVDYIVWLNNYGS